MFGTVVLQFDSENRSVKIYNQNVFKRSKNTSNGFGTTNSYDISDVEIIRSLIKNKRLIAIYEGEEVYIRFLKFPRVMKGAIDSLLNHELNFIFKNIDDISYTYEILRISKKDIELMVFCINTDKNRMLERYFNKNKIKGIFLVQSLFLQYIVSQVKVDTFICSIIYGTNLYILGSLRNKPIFNSIIKKFDGNASSFTRMLQIAQDRFAEVDLRDFEANCVTIYFLNFNYASLLEDISKAYTCINLGMIDESKLISNILSGRGQ